MLIRRLAAAGAECVGIASFGGHFCFDETVRRSVLPLVSAVAPLDDCFVGEGMRRVGLLGTRAVMRTRLCGQLLRTAAVTIDNDIDRLCQLYQEMAVAGVCRDAQRDVFFAAGRRMDEQQEISVTVR